MPPERLATSQPLAQFFLERACAQASRTVDALFGRCLCRHADQPVGRQCQQLQNVVFRAVTMGEGTLINVDELELARGDAAGAGWRGCGDDAGGKAVAEFEKRLLQRLYREFRAVASPGGWAPSHSAIASRLRRYGIG